MIPPKPATGLAAYFQFTRQATEVKKASGGAARPQWREWRRLQRSTGLTYPEYFQYELYRKELKPEEKASYLTRALYDRHLAPLDPPQYAAVVADKYVFAQVFSSQGLPVPRSYGVYHPFHGRTAAGGELRAAKDLYRLLNTELAAPGMVIKPVQGTFGLGVLVFVERGASKPTTLVHVNGDRYPWDKLAGILNLPNPHAHPGYLIEERIEQHPSLAKIHPHSLNTTRVVTLRANDGSLHVIGALLRIGVDKSGVDCLSEQHLNVPVDLATGKMGPVAQREGKTYKRLAEHPVSRVRIAGEMLPQWPEVKQLALKAAAAARNLRLVGWDIGLSPNGPVLIDGNQNWGEETFQVVLGRGLWTPEFRRLVESPNHKPD
jgi:hypothetical protein